MRLILITTAALIFAACDGGISSSSQSIPTAPTTSNAPFPSSIASWSGDQTMVSCSGRRGCDDFTVGETLSGRRWVVTRSDSTVDLFNVDDDMGFRGTMDGRRFVAAYPFVLWEHADHARIEGEFAPDGKSFEAVATYFWADDARSDWHCRVSRNQ